jgi:carbamoyltransferase
MAQGKTILGISGMFHDAAVTLVAPDGEILFAGHAERYSGNKNDAYLNQALIADALQYGDPDVIVYHEKTWAKRLRNLRARSWRGALDPSMNFWVRKFYPELKGIPTKSYWHHETHAAAGVLTSDFDECAVMVVDAIGEFDTTTLWHWRDGRMHKKFSMSYPHSLGLFYSAVTQHVGLKPMEDEYILMGMAAYGNPELSQRLSELMDQHYFVASESLTMKVNLHRGLVDTGFLEIYNDFEIAAAAQLLIERKLVQLARLARAKTQSENLVFMGGVALNCVANTLLTKVFKNIHIMPNPGDAGSSLGAAALHHYNLTGERVNWQTPYLGYNIQGPYPVNKALKSLESGAIFGIANGRAEFGPRALGNRSLLANPTGGDIKDKVNEIKHRQQFRPFAPVILEGYASQYFDMPVRSSPYMQFVARCKHPETFPAIVHADGTSRVQTVNREQHPGLHELLTKFHARTGCPMLLNTSLNVKGKPMVNTPIDALMFESLYDVPVHLSDNG